jgi:hypothetical protein
MGRTSFLSALGYPMMARRRLWVGTWWVKCLLCLSAAGLFFLNILYDRHEGTYQPAEAYLSVAAWLFIMVALIWWDKVGRRVIGWLGVEEMRPGLGWIIWVIIVVIGGLVLSIYIMSTYTGSNREVVTTVPAVVGFSVPIVSAMLAALTITAANYSQLAREQRAEVLRVAQKLVVATVSFVLFVVVFSLLSVFEKKYGTVDPNKLAWGINEVNGGVLYWLSGLSLFLGSGLFVLGTGELVDVLAKVRRVGDRSLRRG